MMTTIEELPISELPPLLFEAIATDIVQYSIGFVNVEETPHGPDIVLLGSGTLVKVGVTYAILTAHHVLKVLPQTGRLGLILSPSLQQHNIDTQGIYYLKIPRGPKESDGPDIGAVVLAPNIAASIQANQANKVFYNLEIRRDLLLKTPPLLCDGVWFVNGFIAERTITVHGHERYSLIKGFQNLSGECSPEPAVIVGEHDYFAVPVSYGGRSVAPKSFGGMSGGGLWQVLLTRDENGNLRHKPPLLSGVVFYQECEREGSLAVKCHGRVSVYQVVYDALNRIEASLH